MARKRIEACAEYISHLAAFGAAITLLMLSFSAFAQQAVVIELRQVVDPDLLAVVSNSVQFRESDDLGNIVDNSTRFQRLDLPQEMGESTCKDNPLQQT